ncbi:MAG: hypothetical protein EBU72_11265 [Betaproteobacteria bacterium]|nr:hypothetical protein [Betaproteobacteria bacterium]
MLEASVTVNVTESAVVVPNATLGAVTAGDALSLLLCDTAIAPTPTAAATPTALKPAAAPAPADAAPAVAPAEAPAPEAAPAVSPTVDKAACANNWPVLDKGSIPNSANPLSHTPLTESTSCSGLRLDASSRDEGSAVDRMVVCVSASLTTS